MNVVKHRTLAILVLGAGVLIFGWVTDHGGPLMIIGTVMVLAVTTARLVTALATDK